VPVISLISQSSRTRSSGSTRLPLHSLTLFAFDLTNRFVSSFENGCDLFLDTRLDQGASSRHEVDDGNVAIGFVSICATRLRILRSRYFLRDREAALSSILRVRACYSVWVQGEQSAGLLTLCLLLSIREEVRGKAMG
jgi:hypothetical protein